MEHSLPVQNAASKTCYWEDIEARAKKLAHEHADALEYRYSLDEFSVLVGQLEMLIKNTPKTQVWKREQTKRTTILFGHLNAWIAMGKPAVIGLDREKEGAD